MIRRNAVALFVILSALAVALAVSAYSGPPARADAAPPPAAPAVAPAGSPPSPLVATGSAFTYQGQLKKGGNPVTAACSFQFKLWDAATSGSQVGSTANLNPLAVNGGLFVANLDFGSQFSGDARWLQTSVQCPGDGSAVTLSPRQRLNATPYALGLAPGAVINGSFPYGTATLQANNSGGGFGLTGNVMNGIGVLGIAGASSGTAFGVVGNAFSPSGYAVYGYATAGTAVRGDGQGSTTGVWGNSFSGYGVYAASTSGVGVRASSSGNIGVQATSSSSHALWGQSISGLGVFGKSTNTNGMQGESTNGAGVYGIGYVGVQGQTNGGQDSQAVRGENFGNNAVGWAGLFNGRTWVVGTLFKSGGAFTIDHPLDPANKTLSHSFVESPDMKNIYDGITVLDAAGRATVALPDWFEALNRDFRYQLTCVGGYAPVYVAKEITGNQFEIAGGAPGLKVSWQVTGIRHDAYADANRIVVEQDKTGADRGTYLNPGSFGLSNDKLAPFLRGAVPDATAAAAASAPAPAPAQGDGK